MNRIFDGVRASDVLLSLALTALGVVLMLEDINSHDAATRIDSRSWLMVPVMAAATVPVLWRRRHLPVVLAVTFAALAVHVAAFGWVVRCGAALPLAFVLAYSAGRHLAERSGSLLALAATIAIQGVVLLRDSDADLKVLPFTTLIGAVCWGVGRWLRHRSERAHHETAPDRVGTFA